MNDPREMKDEAVSTFAKVYVGNLIPKANEIHLHQIFAEYGVIESIWVARKPPGFAFIQYATKVEAIRAIEAASNKDIEILGKVVKVEMAGEKMKKKETESEKVPRGRSPSRSRERIRNRSRSHHRSKGNPRKTRRYSQILSPTRKRRSRSRSTKRRSSSRSRSRDRSRSKSNFIDSNSQSKSKNRDRKNRYERKYRNS